MNSRTMNFRLNHTSYRGRSNRGMRMRPHLRPMISNMAPPGRPGRIGYQSNRQFPMIRRQIPQQRRLMEPMQQIFRPDNNMQNSDFLCQEQKITPPLYNRIFVISDPGYSEENYRNAFNQFGIIQHYKQVEKDGKKTFTYITFKKASEAALAIEKMNGKPLLDSSNNNVRCLLATSKISREHQDKFEEKGKRILCTIGTEKTTDDIKVEFSEYGEVEHVKLLTHRESGASKGMAFITFKKPYHAALALENAPKKYRALFAERKPKNDQTEGEIPLLDQQIPISTAMMQGLQYPVDIPKSNLNLDDYNDISDYDTFEGCYDSNINYDMHFDTNSFSLNNDQFCGNDNINLPKHVNLYNSQPHPSDIIRKFPHENQLEIYVKTASNMNSDNIEHLFKIIPGFESFQFNSINGEGCIKYEHPSCAAYAKDRLDGFEYPLNEQISVSFKKPVEVQNNENKNSIKKSENQLENCNENNSINSANCETEISKTTVSSNLDINNDEQLEKTRFCNFLVPPVKEIHPQEECRSRLFIVSKPSFFSDSIMRNLFCRFGNLIDAYFLSGKNCGFAKFSCSKSANNALKSVDGKEVAGQILRIIIADNEVIGKREGESICENEEPPNKKSK